MLGIADFWYLVLDATKSELSRDSRPGRFVLAGSTRHDALPAIVLLDLAVEAISHLPVALPPRFNDVPLWMHVSYSRDELLAATGHATLERTPASDMQGVRYVEALRTDVLTFTLQKAEADYSPTTMYKDYAVAPDLVHWETQSTTSDTSLSPRAGAT